MYKVLVVGLNDNPGGVESVIMNYYRNIDKSICQFTFLCHCQKPAYEDEILANNDTIIKTPTRRQNFFKFKKLVKQVFKNNSFDAIWFNACSLSNIYVLKLAKKYKIKTRIIHSHNSKNMGSFITGVLHNLNKLVIKNYATDFWACGKLAGKYFYNNKILNSSKYKIIPNAIDLDKFQFSQNTRDEYRKKLNANNKIIFGHVGRFHFQKNHVFLINVFNEFEKLHKDCELVLIGKGEDEEKIKNQINNLGIQNKVNFLGLTNEVHKYLQAFDLMVFPSLFEGLSVSLLEAQATGLPIYASNTVSSETKINSNLNFMSLNSSPKEWAQKIYNDLTILKREENSTKNLQENGFDIKSQVENFIKLIKSKN